MNSTVRSANAFVVQGVLWAAFVPLGLWTLSSSRVGGNEGAIAILLRALIAGSAFWVARSLRRTAALPVPPVAIAAAYPLLAFVSVLHGVSKGVAARSALGFLKLGEERSGPSILFPDLYYSRHMTGSAQGIVTLAGLALVVGSIMCALRVGRSRREA